LALEDFDAAEEGSQGLLCDMLKRVRLALLSDTFQKESLQKRGRQAKLNVFDDQARFQRMR